MVLKISENKCNGTVESGSVTPPQYWCNGVTSLDVFVSRMLYITELYIVYAIKMIKHTMMISQVSLMNLE